MESIEWKHHRFPSKDYIEHSENDENEASIVRLCNIDITTFSINVRDAKLVIERAGLCSPAKISLCNITPDDLSLFTLYLIKAIVSHQIVVNHEIKLENFPNAHNITTLVIRGDAHSVSVHQKTYESSKSSLSAPSIDVVLLCDSPFLKGEKKLASQHPAVGVDDKKFALVNDLSYLLKPLAIRWWWLGNADPDELCGSEFRVENDIIVSDIVKLPSVSVFYSMCQSSSKDDLLCLEELDADQ